MAGGKDEEEERGGSLLQYFNACLTARDDDNERTSNLSISVRREGSLEPPKP